MRAEWTHVHRHEPQLYARIIRFDWRAWESFARRAKRLSGAKAGFRTMPQSEFVTRRSLRTPKAAAFAGIIYSVLLFAIFWLFRASVPADPLESGAWLATHVKSVTLALNLVPFAGVAFLWFVGVLRDRLGEMEDRFFATVFLGSALLFLGTLFAAAAIIGAVILAFATHQDEMINSASFHFARAAAYNLINVYAIKMAGVFMVSTSVVAFHTGFVPRWISYLGLGLAMLLLFGSYFTSTSVLLFPIWTLLVSVWILIENLSPAAARPMGEP